MQLEQQLESHLIEQTLNYSVICILDDELNIHYCNQRFASLLNTTQEALTRCPIKDFTHVESTHNNYDFLASTLNSRQTWKGELQFITSDGETIWLDATFTPAQIDDKQFHIGQLVDSRPRKKLIDGLKQRAHRQGLIAILGQVSLSNIPVTDLLEQTLAVVCGSLGMSSGIILELAINGKSALVKAAYNTPQVKAAKTVIQASRSNLIGFTMSSDTPVSCESIKAEHRFEFPDELIKDSYKSFTSLLIGEKNYPFGIFILFSPLETKLKFDELNFLQSISNILAEAINRKHMEASLKYERELSRRYIDVAEVLIIVLDNHERIVLANQHASHILGCTQNDLAGMNFIDSFIPQEVRQTFRDHFHQLLTCQLTPDTESHTSEQLPIITYDNQCRQIRWKSTVICDDKRPISVIFAGDDITVQLQQQEEQKLLENQLHQAQKMEALGMLAGGIAHDFNNILASILGFSDLAIEHLNNTDAKLASYLGHIRESGIKARDIIEQIQNINLQEESSSRAIVLPSLLKNTLKMLRSALPSSMEIATSIAPDIPAVFINASRFNQLLMHLLINSRNAMNGKGTLSINLDCQNIQGKHCTCCGKLLDHSYAVLTIQDNGPGISKQSITDLLESESADSNNSGLRIANDIVHSSNGHIIISSSRIDEQYTQQGTQIQLLFNLERVNEEKTRETLPIDMSIIANKRLMIVDDENSVASFIAELFRNAGFETAAYCDSIEALETFKRDPDQFDLIITDQTMPGLTGDLLASQMLELRPELPIILCTGHSNAITAEGAEQLHIKGFMKKPVDSAELLHLTLSLLTEASMHRQA